MNVEELRAKLGTHGQEHLVRFHEQLEPEEFSRLAAQIEAIDFPQLSRLVQKARKGDSEQIDASLIGPVSSTKMPWTDPEFASMSDLAELGMSALQAGRVAVVLVAGGQGSRLGFEHPKGMFPIGPVTKNSLFQIHCEKLLAWSRRVGKEIPLLIMTSPSNHEETVEFFRAHQMFGLNEKQIRFFTQGTMPAADIDSGKLLLESKGSLFASPNGHGGCLLALRSSGLLDDLSSRGIDLISYFQVDNSFVEILDPYFLGVHIRDKSEFSLKVIRKREPREKLGVVVNYAGQNRIIEYSDLPDELAVATNEAGELLHSGGSIAIHIFSVPFLRRVTQPGLEIPFHIAKKKVPYVNENGETVSPSEPNAIKFEMFIFDVLPMARRVSVVETSRQEEYLPLKDAEGEHCAAAVQKSLVRRAGQWLAHAGIEFPRDADGNPTVPIEISPLLALQKDEFAKRVRERTPISGPTYFGPDGRKKN